MSSKLDQSLDTIMNEAGTARAGRRGRGRARRSARAAPVGGVRKSTRVAAPAASNKVATKATSRTASKAEAATPSTGGATKVIVSNLPHDVPESDIKEFFANVAGPIKRVMLTYGPNGQSRGVATIIFNKPASGLKALEQNGTVVDKRALRIEAVMDATSAPGNTAKSLSERVTAPNARPKKATNEKPKPNTAARGATAGGTRGRGRPARGRNAGRPKKKTAAELDAEMTDYFGIGGEAAVAQTNGTAAPAAPAPATDDLGMDGIS